jgi:hypothetical protein
MELKFGSSDFAFMDLPDHDISADTSSEILLELNTNLKTIRDISRKYQLDLVQKRDNSNATPSTLNKYQPGDFVLFRFSVTGESEFKLDARNLGPFRVISHIKNDVQVRNLITDAIKTFHSNRLKYFFGTKEEAFDAALRDNDQFVVDHIMAYRGDPLIRTSMYFYVKYRDGTVHWREWTKDLYDTIQYEQYCSSLPQLEPLKVLQKEALSFMKATNLTPIVEVDIGVTAYLDIRAIGAGWYAGLYLPDCDFTTYVVPLIYRTWQNDSHTRINAVIPSLRIEWTNRNAVNHSFVKMWGSQVTLESHMTLITLAFINEYKIITKLR